MKPGSRASARRSMIRRIMRSTHFFTGQTVGKDQRRRESATLRRMDRRRDENDVLPFGDESITLSGDLEPRVHQLALNLAVVLQILECGRIADERDQERATKCRLATRGSASDDQHQWRAAFSDSSGRCHGPRPGNGGSVLLMPYDSEPNTPVRR